MDKYMEYLLMSGQLSASEEIDEIQKHIKHTDSIEISFDNYNDKVLGISEYLEMNGFEEIESYDNKIKRYIRKK